MTEPAFASPFPCSYYSSKQLDSQRCPLPSSLTYISTNNPYKHPFTKNLHFRRQTQSPFRSPPKCVITSDSSPSLKTDNNSKPSPNPSSSKTPTQPPSKRPQSFDFTTLSLTLNSIRSHLPLRLQSIHQPNAHTLRFHLLGLNGPLLLTLNYNNDPTARLTFARPNILSTTLSTSSTNHSPNAKKHSRRNKSNNPNEQYSLGEIAFSLLSNHVLTSVSILQPYDRIACLEFATTISAGHQVDYRIYLELLGGGRNNVVIVDGKDVVKAAGRQISEKQARREVKTGRVYERYEGPRGLFVGDCKVGEVLREAVERFGEDGGGEKVGKVVVKLFAGLSPVVVGELLRCAGIDEKSFVGSLGDTQISKLAEQIYRWHRAVNGKEPVSPTLLEAGGYSVLGWSPSSPPISLENQNLIDSFTLSELLEVYYSLSQHQSTFLSQQDALRKSINSQLKKWQKKEKEFYRKLLLVDDATDLQHQGDLLFAYAHTWKSNSTSIKAEELDGSIIEIEIPKGKSPVEYASSLQKRAQKLRKSKDVVKGLMEKAKVQREYWESVLVGLWVSRDLKDLREIGEEVEEAKENEEIIERGEVERGKGVSGNGKGKGKGKGFGKGGGVGRSVLKEGRKQKMKKKRKVEERKSDFIRVTHEGSGLLVMIGRNNRQNEKLSFEEARKTDLWLHAAERPGSHVLCRDPNGGQVEIDHDAVRFAADLAAWFSSGRENKRVDVYVVHAKELRRIGGSPRRLGLVGFEERSIVEAKPDRVEDIARSLTSSEFDQDE